jgi:two-component system nitrate/nitrite response regulator NarL
LARTVLIVDDSPIVRRTLCSALQSDGFAVCEEANDGQEAIDLAEKLSPDLIILDLSMPVMNGLQAAPVLRKLVPKSPIILYTLHAGGAVILVVADWTGRVEWNCDFEFASESFPALVVSQLGHD